MCEELAACDRHKHARSCVLGPSSPALRVSGSSRGSGAHNSRPTCLPELPWGVNSIQQTSTDAYSVPGPVLGEAGDRDRDPAMALRMLRLTGAGMPDGGDNSESLSPKYLPEETEEDKINLQVRGQEGPAAMGRKRGAGMVLRAPWCRGGSRGEKQAWTAPWRTGGPQERPGQGQAVSGQLQGARNSEDCWEQCQALRRRPGS